MTALPPTPSELVDSLAARLPSVAEDWLAFRRSDEYDRELPYTALGELATAMASGAHRIPGAELDAFFNAVGEVLAAGDAASRNLLIVGFIEDLQNASLHRGVDEGAWTRHMDGEVRAAWTWVNDLWAARVTPSEFNEFVGDAFAPRGDPPIR